MPTWRIRNFQVGVAEFLRRDRKAPLGTIRAKRGTICGTRIYYRVSTIRVTLCFLSSHASKKRSFFLVSEARSTALRVNRSSGWGLPPLAAGALPERRLSFLNLPRRTLFSSGNRSAGWGLPPLAAGALPERRVSFSRLGSKGSLRFVVQLEVAVVQNQ